MSWRKPKKLEHYRDVGAFLQWLRDFLLGRKHNLHARFAQYLSPRSLPVPDVPRTPEYKYSKQYYCNRSYMDSSWPPVVAKIADGVPKTPCDYLTPTSTVNVVFKNLPTPGTPWWWDGHMYYECVPDLVKTQKCRPMTPCPDPCPPPPPCAPPKKE